MKSLFVVFVLFAAVAFAAMPNWYNSWFVIVGGNSGWNSDSYATQSSMYKLYQTIRQSEIPDNRIITFFADDIAYNDQNPFRGQVFNEPYVEGGSNVNVYQGMLKDYTGGAATRENLINVLTGVGSGKVLRSSAYDNVFIYLTGYGNDNGFSMPAGNTPLTGNDIYYALSNMTAKKMYNKLMFIVDAVKSPNMFKFDKYSYYFDNVYLLSPGDLSHSTINIDNYDPYLHVYVKRTWTNRLSSILLNNGLNMTIEDLYATYGSYYPCQFGDSYVKEMTLGEFIHGTNSVSEHRADAIFPHAPICSSKWCSSSDCDPFAICKKRGYDDSRCKKMVCWTNDC